MNYKLPSGTITELMSTYKSLADQTYDIFGSDCDVIYLSKSVSSPSVAGNNIPDLNSVNARRRVSPIVYNNQDDTVSQVETSERVKIKIYWTAKEWRDIYGNTVVPDGHVVFLSKLENANKLNRAIKVRFIDEESNVYIFNRASECVPYGFNKDKYCSSIWKQVE